MKTEPLGKAEELEGNNNLVVDQLILGCDIDESGGFTELQQLNQENESLKKQLEKAEKALKFYADEDKYFVRTKIIDPQKDIIFASRYDEEKGESVPVDLKEPFESKSFEVTARLKVDQGKTAQTYFAEKEKNE